mgnify:CR=1 FL=1
MCWPPPGLRGTHAIRFSHPPRNPTHPALQPHSMGACCSHDGRLLLPRPTAPLLKQPTAADLALLDAADAGDLAGAREERAAGAPELAKGAVRQRLSVVQAKRAHERDAAELRVAAVEVAERWLCLSE